MSPRVVLDASAMVELLLRRPGAVGVERAITAADLIVPAHFDAEVLGGLTRAARLGLAPDAVIERAVVELSRAPLVRLPTAPLVSRAWALRHNLSAADALYVVLARELEASLVTADRSLATAPHLGVPVTVC